MEKQQKKKEPGSELFANLAEPPKEAGGNVSWGADIFGS